MDNFEKLSIKAYKEEKLDNNINIIDKYYYIELKNLYLDYRCGKTTKEKTEIRKKKLKNEYTIEMKYYNRYMEICREYNDNRIKMEYDLSKIEKSKNKDEILKIALKIIGRMVHDEDFTKRNSDELTF